MTPVSGTRSFPGQRGEPNGIGFGISGGILGYMTTTIKVPTRLRERVQQHAQRSQASQADVLERALDLLDREDFFAELRHRVAEHPETSDEQAEREQWLAGPFEDGA